MLSATMMLVLLPWVQDPPSPAPVRLEYPALVEGLIDLRWMCEAPRPGEGCDALEAQSAGAAVEIAHVRGPGIVGRIWCSRADGTMSIYADGAAEPAASWDLTAFALRDEASELPPEPLAGTLGSGWYSVIPLPFQREVRILWQPDASASAVRLQADVRRLGSGVEVPTATAALLASSHSDWQRVARMIADGQNPETYKWPGVASAKVFKRNKVDATSPHQDGSFYYPVRGSGIIRWIEVWLPQVGNPADLEREIRSLTMRLETGNPEVSGPAQLLFDMPLGDLFGSGIGLNPYEQYLHSFTSDGHFYFRLPIPYDEHLRISFSHPTKDGVMVAMRIGTDPMPPELIPPLRLRGGLLLADAREIPALDLPGPARLISYAWSSQASTDDPWQLAAPFAFADFVTHPRRGAWQQVTHRDGPGRFGRSALVRIFGQDAPVAAAGERLRFAPAATFSGVAGKAQVAARALWYGSADLDGNFGAVYTPEQRALQPVVTPSFHLVPGAIEAEGAAVKDLTRGAAVTVEDWSAQAPKVSRKEVLVLRPAQAGDQVLLEFTPAVGGEYELVACFGRGSALGRVQAFLDGRKAGEAYDAAAEQTGLSEEIVLQRGTFLPRAYTLAIRAVDDKPVALDYLRLRAVQ